MVASSVLEIVASVRDKLTTGFDKMAARSNVAFTSMKSGIKQVGAALTSLRVLVAGFWARQLLRFLESVREATDPAYTKRYTEAVDRVGKAWSGILAKLGERLLPALGEALEGVSRWFEQNSEKIAAGLELAFKPLEWILSGLGKLGQWQKEFEKWVFRQRSGGVDPTGDRMRDLMVVRQNEILRGMLRDYTGPDRLENPSTGEVRVNDDTFRGLQRRAGDQAQREVYGVQPGQKTIEGLAEIERNAKKVPSLFAQGAEAGAKRVQAALEGLTGSFGLAYTMVLDTAQALSQNLSGALSSVILGTMKGTAALRSFAAAMLESIVRTSTNSIANNLVGALVGAISGGSGGGGKPGKPGGPPEFAEGTITNGPQYALIGDNPGGREAVIPMPDGRTIPVQFRGGGTGGVVNNYYISAVDSQSFAAAFQRSDRAHGLTRGSMIGAARRDNAVRSKFRVR